VDAYGPNAPEASEANYPASIHSTEGRDLSQGWKGPITLTYCPYQKKASAVTTRRFPLEGGREKNPSSMPCGTYLRIRSRCCRRSKGPRSRFYPDRVMKSRAQLSTVSPREVVPERYTYTEWRHYSDETIHPRKKLKPARARRPSDTLLTSGGPMRAAEKYWSPDYIPAQARTSKQVPRRIVQFDPESSPPTLRYEPQLIVRRGGD